MGKATSGCIDGARAAKSRNGSLIAETKPHCVVNTYMSPHADRAFGERMGLDAIRCDSLRHVAGAHRGPQTGAHDRRQAHDRLTTGVFVVRFLNGFATLRSREGSRQRLLFSILFFLKKRGYL
jgi:hypothetical protein